ncbi:hypothetical protein SAMN04487941_1235 [Pontibacter akesuensis]|uniref:Uncharacterized protein n=1 Tax=Pontibacter akesuensis TaxID=388950 RepID=A0A1I7GSP7_9BACT|nr:hypothetical protein SAMN04487941_1235 [Pontibacter akesuensis]
MMKYILIRNCSTCGHKGSTNNRNQRDMSLYGVAVLPDTARKGQ